MGYFSTASGYASTAIGASCLASGPVSVALGGNCTADAPDAVAIGQQTQAHGIISTAIGYQCVANGGYSLAMGSNVSADGDFSHAIGYGLSTVGAIGGFIIGDYSTTTVLNLDTANRFVARFASGYELFTNSTATIGAKMLGGDNSWSAISDVRRKENFVPVNGEAFLNKIDNFKLSSWNYKEQSGEHRHYGPMAQDFYAAFGHDGVGTIGCDTLINQQDFLGVNFIAVQALVKRTDELKKENEKLKTQLLQLSNQQTAKADASDVSALKLQIQELKLLMQQNGLRTEK